MIIFLASISNENFSTGKTEFFLEIDFYLNKTLSWLWRMGQVLYSYFIPCHRKYSGQQNHAIYARPMIGRLSVVPSNIQRLSCILIGCIFFGIV